MRQTLGKKKLAKLREQTGLPIVAVLVRGNSDHRKDLCLEDKSIVHLYKDGTMEKAEHNWESSKMDNETTHAEGCWSWGPKHYECAKLEIERLRFEHECAHQEAEELRQQRDELLGALTDFMAQATGSPKSCGHNFHCICAGDKAKAAIAKYASTTQCKEG